MKKRIFNLFTIVALTSALIACKDKAKEAETSAAEEAAKTSTESVKYMASSDNSTIEWTGSKPTGKHNGTIKIESGVINVSNGKPASGTFLIDMSSIVNLDIPADDEKNGKLVGHLKSADFFDVEKYPNAAFEITGFEEKDGKSLLSGNLQLKDKKNNVTFPVSIATEGDNMTLTSEEFSIDRSKWDVRYGSKSFFDNLGDKFINDNIELKISLKATKS